MSELIQFILSGLTNGAIYALIALGFTIIYNATEVINFAQGEFVMLGAMFMATFCSLRLPIPLAFLLSVGLTSLVGIIIERLAIYPARQASHITLIIITIGLSILIKGVAMFVWGKDPLSVPSFLGDKPIKLLGATIIPQKILIVCATLICVLLIEIFFRKTLVGKAMRAAAANRLAARLIGVKVEPLVLLAFALSAATSAVAGVVISPITFATYDMGTLLGLKGFSAAVLGGLTSGLGAVIGGFVLGLLESFAAGFISSAYKDAAAFVILILVLLLKPEGLFGKGAVKKL
ncbi:inner-membrane translocator [Thermodesulfatator indicus DSM 15286]|uniref:Inner-membrane translocator n=1 Tax=Thermodesulfatator indicus (strain DSM 15286 / JCM 11887 / CIR29812) TaxID=667014 RepID=F8A9T6_THEID|nr:branched-chain amino acid ABC transporter permease [Thermodesulfatator indicus]AEH44134.1 inner-membrane translocator [Thermodesulfatator indicus DSM 15286]